MLTLTDNARIAVQDLATQANLPDGGGLRIAAADGTPGDFDLALVTEAPATDEVIELDGTHVYVEPVASTSLADLSLDADASGSTTSFTLAPRQD
ncbi:Fe-S cluster assembly iron-binding protein IscA [Sanguibacter gelidistatuariae]|uniref:Fe-S cluster assembly iron-binding protein IscA n=1 Tax=Sanguibacter gelidistatuariae TaxID=1814289 RepID=A0A1G6HID1_9MICO|nr:iron-sulfur cluster biosynthesis family protein [Sanguibacter gelidistatuariae]SDB94019.1 Fe-S cluster assembly iron-binding protein IscA [Sanguibacter gelidistatuariae]